MHFSTINPPLPSLLILVTKGPTLLEQPEIIITDSAAIKAVVVFLILSPIVLWVFLMKSLTLSLAATL